MKDQAVFSLIEQEHQRQLRGIELIASENFVSDEVMQAMGSCLTNKYAEGYPGHRYYGGCEIVDQTETLAIERAKELFGADYANVQLKPMQQYCSPASIQAIPLWDSTLITEVTSLMVLRSTLPAFSIIPSAMISTPRQAV